MNHSEVGSFFCATNLIHKIGLKANAVQAVVFEVKQERTRRICGALRLDSLRSSCCPSRDVRCSRMRKRGRVSVTRRCRGAFCHGRPPPPLPRRPRKPSRRWATRRGGEVRASSKRLSSGWRGGGGRRRGWRRDLFLVLDGGEAVSTCCLSSRRTSWRVRSLCSSLFPTCELNW